MDKFNLLELFLSLDNNRDSYICAEDIDIFLRNKQIVLYQEEIMHLLYLYDEDMNKKWNWNEFLFMILPSNTTYNYDFGELRELENEYIKIYYDIIRREKQMKEKRTEINNEYQHPNPNPYKMYTYNNMYTEHSNILTEQNANIENSYYINDNYEYVEREREREREREKDNNYNKPVYTSNNFSDTRAYTIDHDKDRSGMSTGFSKYNNNDLEFFINEIYNILLIDKDIEKIKRQLAYQDSFNLINIFRFFDRNKHDYVSFNSLIAGLECFNLYPKINEAELLFKKYDKHSSGRIK